MLAELFQGGGIEILGCAQTQLLGCEVADGLAVHGEVDGACARNHLNAHLLKVEESFGSDGFNLWYDNVRLVTLHHSGKRVAVQHVENLMFVGNLHCRCVLILVACNDILSCTLGGDDKFLAQFART